MVTDVSLGTRFNPRPRAAGDWTADELVFPVLPFQSTPARGGRRSVYRDLRERKMFQSTPARGGRPRYNPLCANFSRCFNPRPRAAGDCATANCQAHAVVSIHARARRATRILRALWIQAGVSIHARARRAT